MTGGISADRQRAMLRTAMGPAIAEALADPRVIEIMVNPDGALRLDRLGEGRTDTEVRMEAAQVERIIRLVASHARAEVHGDAPIVSAELPPHVEGRAGERFEGVLPPVSTAPCFSIRKPAERLYSLRPDGSNPRRHIRKYVEQKRERFLSAAELRRLGEVLGAMEAERVEPTSAIAAVRLLVLTGCRLNEIMKLRWEHVDLPARMLRLPDSKTGAKAVHLGQAAIAAVSALSRDPFNPHVIPGTLPGKPLSDLQPFWRRVRARVGLKDVRLHDLRHTYASVAVAAGQSLPMIGKLLGHTQVQTTARYAHLAGDPVHAAANDVSSAISANFR